MPCTFLGKHLRFSRANLDQIIEYSWVAIFGPQSVHMAVPYSRHGHIYSSPLREAY